MALCHQAANTVMEQFISGLGNLKPVAAIDVGCVDGRVTRDLLLGRFKQVDLFDPCPIALDIVQTVTESDWQVMRVEEALMETYAWKSGYSLIVLRWCIGYVTD